MRAAVYAHIYVHAACIHVYMYDMIRDMCMLHICICVCVCCIYVYAHMPHACAPCSSQASVHSLPKRRAAPSTPAHGVFDTAGVVPEPPRSPAKSIYDIHGRLVHSGNIVPGDDALDTDHEVRDPTNEMSDIREAGQLDEAPPIFLTAE